MKHAQKKNEVESVETVAKPTFTVEASDMMFAPKGRSIGQQFSQPLVGFEALSEYLKGAPSVAVSKQMQGEAGLSGEAGIRFALVTGYLSPADCDSNLKNSTECTPKVKQMLKTGIAKGRSIVTTLLDLQREQGTTQDGYKAGMRFGMPSPKGDKLLKSCQQFVGRSPFVKIIDAQSRDALVALGFVGLSDIETFPSVRVMLYEAGRSVVPSVSTDSK
jgi:hypothetical protein